MGIKKHKIILIILEKNDERKKSLASHVDRHSSNVNDIQKFDHESFL